MAVNKGFDWSAFKELMYFMCLPWILYNTKHSQHIITLDKYRICDSVSKIDRRMEQQGI